MNSLFEFFGPIGRIVKAGLTVLTISSLFIGVIAGAAIGLDAFGQWMWDMGYKNIGPLLVALGCVATLGVLIAMGYKVFEEY